MAEETQREFPKGRTKEQLATRAAEVRIKHEPRGNNQPLMGKIGPQRPGTGEEGDLLKLYELAPSSWP